jgi:epsilon-lactone hydrolase
MSEKEKEPTFRSRIAELIFSSIGKLIFSPSLPVSIRRKMWSVATTPIHTATFKVRNKFTKTSVFKTKIPILEFTPKKKWEGTILYIHGGGFVLGSHKIYASFAMQLTKAANCRVVIPDYRLAPEFPFPAGLEDIVNVYKEILNHESPENIYIVGDSAGGGLSTSLVTYLRNNEIPLPRAVSLLSPFVDLTFSGESWETNKKNDRLFGASSLENLPDLYCPEDNVENPLISPIKADLSHLPPFYLIVGSAECLYSDSEKLHEKLLSQGTESTLSVWDGRQHVFPLMAPISDDAREAIKDIASFIDGHKTVPATIEEEYLQTG